MDDSSALQLHDDEGKERVEEEVGDLHEAVGPDLVRMVVLA